MNALDRSKVFLDVATDLLRSGHRMRFRAGGSSMWPTIRPGEAITVEPATATEVKLKDIVLYRTGRGVIGHRVVGIANQNGELVLLARGDADQGAGEPVAAKQLLGKVLAVEREGRNIDLTSRRAKMKHFMRTCALSLKSSIILSKLIRQRNTQACSSKRCTFLVVVALMCPAIMKGSVAVTNQASNIANGSSISITSFNAITGVPNLLLVGVAMNDGNNHKVTSVTWGTILPQSFSCVVAITDNNMGSCGTAASASHVRMEIWSLLFPVTLTSTVTVTLDATEQVAIGVVAFSGVTSLGSSNHSQSNSNSATGATVSVIPPGTGGVTFSTLGVGVQGTATGFTPTSPAVLEFSQQNSMVAGAGSVASNASTMSWSWTSGSPYALGAVAINPISITAVTMRSFNATAYEAGNLIEIKTGREVSSLGFNLYREQNGQRFRLNSSLLAGTALLAGPKTTFTSGHSHAWLDKPETGGEAAYWVEEVDLNGDHTMFGPVYTEQAAEDKSAALSPLISEHERSTLKPEMLSELGRAPALAPYGGARSCGPVNSGSRPFQRTGGQPVITPRTQQQQYALAADPAIKISVCAEGWYRLTRRQLLAAGLSPDVDPRLLQLYVDGKEQPMIVSGHADGKLDPQDTVEFYGYPLNTTWSGTQVYWLVAGSTNGKRVPTETLSAATNAGPANFPATVVWNPRTVYFAALLNGDADNFFGPVLGSGSPVTNSFAITNLDTTATANAQLEVLLQGVSSGAHVVGVQLNDFQAGTVKFSNQRGGVAKLALPVSALQQGSNNLLTLTVQGGQQDISVVNTVQLTYPHTYTADDDYLRLTATSGMKQTIGGFSNSQIRVVDITNPGAVTALRRTIARQGTGYAVSVVPQGSGTRTLLAFTSAQSSRPASLVRNNPSSWHAAQAGADVVIISHADFLSSLSRLQTLRQNQGHAVATIDVQDLYDEFNFGVKSPYALKKFLRSAKERWSLTPHFVLLVGDATFDPRNYLGVGEDDFVPTYLIDTQLLETASDDWFADSKLDGLSEMAVGRLPVRTSSDASMLANRIVNYETSSSGAWTNQVLLVAGTDDATDPFTSYISAVQALIPGTQTVSVISQGNDSNAHGDLITALNAGQSLVNFAGHGSDEVWAGELLSSSDVAALTNGSQTPFVILMTCLNGYFQDVYTVSLAKAIMLAPSGGAVAAWASSGLTDSSGQSILDQAIVSALYGSQSLTVGEAAAAAKRAVTNLDIRRTWILLGDPATKLK